MKKVIVLLLMFSAALVAQTTQKIGYVDSQVILEQFSEAIKAQSDLDALAKKWNAQLDSMKQALETAYANYQKQAATMTEQQLKEAQQKLVKMQEQAQNFTQAKFGQPNGELYQKQEEYLAPVRAKIVDAINSVANQEGMQFVFDKAGDVVLLFADAEYDLTFKVLDLLRKTKK